LRHDYGVSDLLVYVVPQSAISDEELAAATRDLRDDLDEVRGVAAGEVTAPAPPGTRDAAGVVLGVVALSLFGLPTAIRARADLRHLAEILRRYQERNRGRSLRVELADGTEIAAATVSEEELNELLRKGAD